MYIIMSCFFVLLCGILVLRVTSINVTNNGNQQDIIDMKKDIVMLRNLVTGMNTTILTQQQEMRSMNTTIYTQQQEMRSMNTTICTQQQDMRSMNTTIYTQQQEMRSMDTTIYTQHQEMRSMNTTIYTQHQEMRSMNTTIYTQQQEMKSMNTTIYTQQQEMRSMNTTIYTQQQIERSINTTFKDQQRRITVMEGTIQILKQENQTLNEEVEFLRKNNSAEIEHLKDVDENINQNYEAFQIVVQDLVTNVNTLRNTSQLQIGSINDNLTSVAREAHYTSLSFLDSQKILKELENAIKERNRMYAFTVSTLSHLSNYHNKKIVYDKVITNEGGAYSSNTGIFTCPSPGTYVFMWSTMSDSGSGYCIAYIYQNGNRLLESYSYERNGGYAEVASNTVVLALTVGDHVWIATGTGTFCHGYPYTGFSGWKI